MNRLENLQGVEPIEKVQDIIDIIRHGMEALQPEPEYPADNKQLVFDELVSILDFFGTDYPE